MTRDEKKIRTKKIFCDTPTEKSCHHWIRLLLLLIMDFLWLLLRHFRERERERERERALNNLNGLLLKCLQ